MNITVNENRKVEKKYEVNEGSQNENRITELTFTLPAAYDDFVHKIVFITEDGNYTDYIENDNTYTLKNNVTKYRKVKSYVWLTDSESNKDFRSELFELEFNYNEDPSDYIPSEEQKSQIELLMEELDELIQEVEALPSMSRQIVEELPTEDIDPTVIYMVLRENTEPNDVYDEYLYIDDDWELIGNTYVDLSGYQQKIDSSHKLDADLVDDTSTTHKFTTASEKTKLSGIETGAEVNIIEGITLNGSSLTPSSKVVALTNIERSTNKVTSLSSSSTDTQYPSAKCVYDLIGDLETILNTLDVGGGVNG